MAIPDYQSLMLPLLSLAADGMEYSVREAREHLAALLGLTDQERMELLPSGRQPVFDNRVAWAPTSNGQDCLLHPVAATSGLPTAAGRFSAKNQPLSTTSCLSASTRSLSLGVTTLATYEIKRINSDYFGEVSWCVVRGTYGQATQRR